MNFPSSRRSARELLDALFPTSTDLTAFLIDCFFDVHKRIPSGMDRRAQTNLFLELVHPTHVFEALDGYFAADPAARSHLALYVHHPQTQAEISESADDLEALCILREEVRLRGECTAALDHQIRENKRQVRQRPVLQPEQVINERFKLLELIDKGGGASIWQAFDRRTELLVAIRVLHSDWGSEDERITRFLRGVRWMQKLQHPHIARVIGDAGEHAGFRYFAMEYLPGGSLDRAVRMGKLPLEHRLKLVFQAGEALSYMHSRGAVHRDVKPSNIMIDSVGDARLVDFDLIFGDSPESHTGPLGTLAYAAPEAAERGQSPDYRMDVYSLAMTTAFVLHGQEPKPMRYSAQQYVQGIACPPSVREVLLMALQPDPCDRLPSVHAFLQALRLAFAQPEVTPQPSGSPTVLPLRPQPAWNRRLHSWLRGTVTALAVVLFLVTSAMQHAASPVAATNLQGLPQPALPPVATSAPPSPENFKPSGARPKSELPGCSLCKEPRLHTPLPPPKSTSKAVPRQQRKQPKSSSGSHQHKDDPEKPNDTLHFIED